MLGISLFGDVNVSKNADPDRYFYFGGSTGFDARQRFSLPDDKGFVIVFGAEMSSLLHINHKNKI